MPKIQILNETQVDHFYNLLEPMLEKEFNKVKIELLEEAERIKDNFSTHEEVIKLKKEQEDHINKMKAISILIGKVKEIDENLIINSKQYSDRSVISGAVDYFGNPEETIKEIEKSNKEDVDELLLELAQKSLNVNDCYKRYQKLESELRARLCMTAVDDADSICEYIMGEIEIESFFTN